MAVKIFEKLLAEWVSADDKEYKFQQLLESWIKTVDTKNAYRQLLSDWVETDQNLKNRFENLLTEWVASEDVRPYDAVFLDLKESKSKGCEYLKLLQNWTKSEETEHPVKNWFEEWVSKATNEKGDTNGK